MNAMATNELDDGYWDALMAEQAKVSKPLPPRPFSEIADSVDDSPQFLFDAELREALSDEEVDAKIRAAFKHRPVFLSDLRAARDAGYERPKPMVGRIEGRDCGWLYEGKSHSLSGEPGKGKTLLGQFTGFEHCERGGGFLFLDWEKGPDAFVDRTLLLGVSDETAGRVAYWNRPGALAGKKLETVIKFALKFGLDFVMIDSMSRSLTEFGRGWSENSNDNVREWYATAIDPLVQAGLTVLIIDHLSRPSNERGWTPGRYAKGATDKLGVIDGSAFVLFTVEAFSAKEAGYAQLINAKDNNGGMTEGEVVAEFFVTPLDDGSRMDAHLRAPAPAPAASVDGGWRPTVLMERVSAFLEGGVPSSKAAVIKAIGGKESAVARAIEVLELEGFVTVEDQGRGKAKMVSFVRAFVDAPVVAPVDYREVDGWDR